MKQKLFFVTLIAISMFSLLLVSCAPPADNGAGPVDKIYTSTLTGTVVDKNGNPLSGVSVTTRPQGHSTVTIADGTFELSDLNADIAYTLHFDNYNYIDTLVGAFTLGLDDIDTIPAPVKLKYRYATIDGKVYLDAARKDLAVNAGIEVEKQPISQILPTGSFFLQGVEPSSNGQPIRIIAAKEGKGFGYLDVVVPPDSLLSDLSVVINPKGDQNGGTVTGNVVEPASGPAKRIGFGKSAAYRPVPGVIVTAFGGALTSVTDDEGNYLLRNMPSIGSATLTFTMKGKTVAIMDGVTAIEGGVTKVGSIVTLPRVVIGSGSATSKGIVLMPSSVTLTPGDTVITPRVTALPSTSGDTIRIARYYWDYDGKAGYDDSTKTGWLNLDTARFAWQPGETKRSVFVKARTAAGVWSDSVAVAIIRELPRAAVNVLAGVVMDHDSALLANVTVHLAGANRIDTTGVDGAYAFRTDTASDAPDTLVFRKEGFVAAFLPLASRGGALAPILLDTLVPPSVTDSPVGESVVEGDSVTFTVAATGSDTLRYTWQKNNSTIPGATSATLKFATVLADDSTRYRCIVSNEKGSDTSAAALLRVAVRIIPPAVKAHPRDTMVVAGSYSQFNVSVTGTLPLTYQWTKNGVEITGATGPSYTTPAAALGDNGSTYRCAVKNVAGSAKSSAATLTVLPAGTAQMKLIAAAGKSFDMGQFNPQMPDTVHQVSFTRDYYIDSTEVTVVDYEKVMGVNPLVGSSGMNPIGNVTWFDAVLYCNERSRRDGLDTVYSYVRASGTKGNGCSSLERLGIDHSKNGYRLPTEAQWEYACRAGSTTDYWWGSDTAGLGARAWNYENAMMVTKTVATTIGNGWKLYDLTGNVAEWCNDWYGLYTSYTPLTDPAGPATGTSRVFRGGSVYDYPPFTFRSGSRSNWTPSNRGANVGFRCVLPKP